MSFLSVQNVSKVYQQKDTKTTALDQVSFDLDLGESLAIVGGSGAGKSTLLNLIGGLDYPSTGKILVNNQDLKKMNDKQISKFRNQTLGFIFQFHHLLKDFSVLENVMMPLRIQGLNPDKIMPKARDLLKKVGLNDKEERFPRQLSGGEQQRVALVRGMIHEPKLILADEPTGNLDDENAYSVFELLCDLNRDLKAALIVVTHNIKLAETLKTKIILKNGKRV